MSFGELMVVVLVIIIVLKPEDIPIVVNRLIKLKKEFDEYKGKIYSYINKQFTENDEDNFNEINSYIKKITELDETYKIEYDLKKVRDHYNKLLEEKHDKATTNKEISKD